MDPLIITSNDPMVRAGPDEIEQAVEQGVRAAEAGAAILHHHCVFRQPTSHDRRPDLDIAASVELIRQLRDRTDAVIQLGITAASNESRMEVARRAEVDMFSITLSDNDHYAGRFPPVRRDRPEMETLARFCREHSIVPEWEIFSAGAAWNLRYLIERGLAQPPYWINLCLYHEGSDWSPRTSAEIDHRASLLPEGSIWSLTAFARRERAHVLKPISPGDHTRLLAHAVLVGGHVRTGREDRPELKAGVPVETNAELVEMIAELARMLERKVASSDDAYQLLGIGQRSAA